MRISARRVSVAKTDSPHASRTAAATGAASVVSSSNAKHALPLPLIRGANPNRSRSCPSSVGSATNFANAGASIVFSSSPSAGSSASASHAASRASANSAGRYDFGAPAASCA